VFVTKLELLHAFAAKAGCMHTQYRAGQLWEELKPLLTAQERAWLMTAWGHHTDVRLGRGELDHVVRKIEISWRVPSEKAVVCKTT